MNVLLLIAVILGITIIGGGLGLLFYLRTRPKRETWTAYVYGIGEGIKEISINKDGDIVGKFQLKDLIPYKKDTLLKINKEFGRTVYKLISLGISTQQPSPDSVDVWGNGERVVNVLIVGNNATILKQGYNVELGERVFRPMPRERLEMVISEAEIKKHELDSEKSFLQSVLPWIAVGIMALAIVGVAYFEAQGIIESSKNFDAGTQHLADSMQKVSESLRDGLRALGGAGVELNQSETIKYGKQQEVVQEPQETIK